MTRIWTVIVTVLLILNVAYAQDIKPVVQMAIQKKIQYGSSELSLFKKVPRPDLASSHLEYVNGQDYLHLDLKGISDILSERPGVVTLKIPGEEGIQLDLYQKDIFAPRYKIRTPDGFRETDHSEMIFYRGMIAGDFNSTAVVSIVRDEIRIMYSSLEANYRIQKVESNDYVHYKDDDLIIAEEMACFVEDEMDDDKVKSDNVDRSSFTGTCVEVYFECDYESFLDNNSSIAETEGWVAMLFNEVSVLYDNIDVPVSISDIKVWDTEDPYIDLNSPGAVLNEFVDQTQSNGYDGRLAHFLSTRSLGGGIAYVNVLCSSSIPNAVSTSLSTNINPFPNYSWNVEVVAHEIGHNFGSRHTHRCWWNGDNTQIDDCGNVYVFNAGGTPEGNACFDTLNPILPEVGTVMSYCHLVSGVGISFTEGFGPQPGDLIYDKYVSASCNTGDCQVPDCTTLSSPADGATDVLLDEELLWNVALGADGYKLDIGTTPGGVDIENGLDVGNTTLYDASTWPPNATIYVTITPYNSLGDAVSCAEESFTTGISADYCDSQGNNSQFEWISSFSMDDFTKASGGTAYSDYTSDTIAAYITGEHSISVTPDFSGNIYSEGFRIWIDLDQNGVFNDPDELMFEQGLSSNTVNGTFTIPGDTPIGPTRLRVSMKWNAFPGSCETFSYGEVEDYTLDIKCNLITNTNESGPGSLNYALGCSEPGDTLYFSSLLANQTIEFFETFAFVSSDAVLIADPLDNITICGQTTPYVFDIAQGISVDISGVNIIAGTSNSGAAILNRGALTLSDVNINPHPGGNSGDIVRNEGLIVVTGNCNIYE